MKNIERLSLELSHQPYLSNEDYTALLEEHGLDSQEEYEQEQDRRKLLCTVLSVLQIMANDIDL